MGDDDELRPVAHAAEVLCKAADVGVVQRGFDLVEDAEGRRVSDKTQFIVITHRRGTMEAANVLYGVTMQEDGVSKLLKLDLEQVDATLVS